MPSNAELVDAFQTALQPVVEKLDQVNRNTRTTADAQRSRFGGGAPTGTPNMAPSIFGEGIAKNRFAGPLLSAGARKVFGVRGARGLGFRLPMFLPGAAGVAGAAIGGAIGGVASKAFDTMKRIGFKSVTEANRATAKSNLTFSEALPGQFMKQSSHILGGIIPEAAETTDVIDRAFNRVAGMNATPSRGGFVVPEEILKRQTTRVLAEEILAARTSRRVETLRGRFNEPANRAAVNNMIFRSKGAVDPRALRMQIERKLDKMSSYSGR